MKTGKTIRKNSLILARKLLVILLAFSVLLPNIFIYQTPVSAQEIAPESGEENRPFAVTEKSETELSVDVWVSDQDSNNLETQESGSQISSHTDIKIVTSEEEIATDENKLDITNEDGITRGGSGSGAGSNFDNKETGSSGDATSEGTGSSYTINVCFMIADQFGNIATSAVGLPANTGFRLGLSETKIFNGAGHPDSVGIAEIDVDNFSPNQSIILNGVNDAECKTFFVSDFSPSKPVYYSTEELLGNWEDIQPWLTEDGLNGYFFPKYNDQFTVTVESLDDFFAYTPELFDTDPSNDSQRNDNSDGLITMKPNRPVRTLVVLNTYRAEAVTGSIRVCKMIADQFGNIATSSASLPVGGFRVDLYNSKTFNTPNLIGWAYFDAPTFSPNASLILNGVNDAECETFSGLSLNGNFSRPFFYGQEYLYGDWEDIEPWLVDGAFLPKYNDQFNQQVNGLNDFYSYTPQLFDNDPTNDDERNHNSDGQITLREDRLNRTLVILNRYRATAISPNPVNTPPTITLIGDNPLTIVRGNSFTDPGATAFDAEDGDLTSQIVSSGNVDINTLGSYTRHYSVTDSGGLSASTTRTVNVVPGGGGGNPTGSLKVCKMIADSNGQIATSSAGLPGGTFNIYLATTKNFGASIFGTANFNASNFTPNQSIILGQNDAQCITFSDLTLNSNGSFDVFYSEELVTGTETNGNPWANFVPLYNDQHGVIVMSLSDFFQYSPELFDNDPSNDSQRNLNSDGYITLETGRASRTLVVLNRYPATATPINTPPTITLIGNNPMTVILGNTFNDPGATAFDAEDGDLTHAIVTTGSVNTNALGSYMREYSVTDSGGLSATTSRIVNVVEPNNPGGGGGGGGRRSSSGGMITPTPQACSYLEDFLRRDWNNDPIEMLKLQLFLRNFEGFSNLEATAVFDDPTFVAVSEFQVRYFGDILEPWGHTGPTGFVYILTKKKINEIYCNTIYPLTQAENQEIAEFRALLESLRTSSDIPGVLRQIEELDLGNLIGEETSTSTIANIFPPLPTGQENVLEKSEQNGLRRLAAAVFSVPSDIGELVQSLYLVLIALVSVYLVTEIILGLTDKNKVDPAKFRVRRYGSYAALLIAASLISSWFEAYSIIVPLIILAVISGALAIMSIPRPSKPVKTGETIELPPPNDNNSN